MSTAILVLCTTLLQAHSTPRCLSKVLPPDGKRLAKPAGKGVYLYSWKAEDGTMRFSLRWGTNSLNSEAEVKASACALSTPAEVKAILNRLAEGEQVFWMWDRRECPSCSYPNQEVVAEVAVHAKQAGIAIETDVALRAR